VNLQGFSKELGLIGRDLAALLDREEVPPEVRRQARDIISTEMGESIGFIQSAVTRLSGIIDALLRLSRAGKVEYRRQLVEVSPIVARVISALRGTIEERGATVAVAELPPAWGDPTAIEQVFANLIGNAINYLDRERPGLIEVFSPGPDGVVGPADAVAPGSVIYAVKDNGLGISPSYKTKVFAAFQRLHGDVAKGEGIGLTLVRRMVERHGGRVWFDSEPGRGTTFYVSLPSPEPDAEGPGDAVGASRDGESSLASTANENGRNAGWLPSQ
jgi:signal transduction histidine kinase